MSVRRITLAVDTAHRDVRTLRDATRIAAQLKAELTALLVTSDRLQRFAGLPTATEVLLRSARARRLQPADLASDLEQLLGQITDALGGFAREVDVAWSVVRRPLEALPDIPSTDLVLVDRRAGHSPVSRTELGSLAAKLVTDLHQSVLVFERALALEAPVGVLAQSHQSGAFSIAADFARASGRLLALIDAVDRAAFEREAEYLRESLAPQGIEVDPEWISEPRVHLLSARLHTHRSGMLVVDAAHAMLQREGVAGLLDALRVPVLLTR